MADNYTLRKLAREQLDGSIFNNNWLYIGVLCLIPSIIEIILGFIPVIGVLAFLFLAGPLAYSLCRATTNLATGREWSVKTMLDGAKEGMMTSFFLHFLQGLFLFLWGLLLIVPAIVKSYSYAMAFFLKQDEANPQRNAVEYITLSRKMMYGYKMQLFLLDLSFIGWYVLGLLCFGIGVLFVIPYHRMARANFYLQLKSKNMY